MSFDTSKYSKLYIVFNDTILSYKCVKDREVPLAQWIRRVPTEHEIPGSSPGWYIFDFSIIIH